MKIAKFPTKYRQPIRFLIPEGFDGKYSQHQLHFIHRLCTAPYKDKRIQNGWTPCSATVLRDIYGKQYKQKVIQPLIDDNIAEYNDAWKYQEGHHCKHYRLSPETAKLAFHYVSPTNKELITKLKRNRQRPSTEVGRYLEKMFYESITITTATATPKNQLKLDFKNKAHQIAYDMMVNLDLWFTLNKHCGRIFNNLTNLPKPLRKYILAYGKPLEALDVQNSQPTILIVALKNSFKSEYKNNGMLRNELAHYQHLCETTGIYEHLNDHPLLRHYARNSVKLMFFVCIYGENKVIGRYQDGRISVEKLSSFAKAFSEMFPEIWRLIYIYKERNGYKKLSLSMQLAEAKIIIRGVCGRIMKECPGKPIYTVHDSVLCHLSEVPRYTEIMREEFGKAGLNPPIRQERFSGTDGVQDFETASIMANHNIIF